MNLLFDQLQGVVPPTDEPPRMVKYERTVDLRTVTFESAINITFSDYMSGKFQEFLTVAKEQWSGPNWFRDAWEATLEIINNQGLNDVQKMQVIDYLLGKADHIILYQG